MITAEEYFEKETSGFLNERECKELMIEFAKLHVEEAKKEYHKVLMKQGIVTNAGIGYFDNTYSLDNIK